jgi:hypothetical protein
VSSRASSQSFLPGCWLVFTQWISGGMCSHGGAEARRKQRATRGVESQRPATRAIGVSRAFAWALPVCSGSVQCVKRPWLAHRCFALPRSSILCGCINVPGRQVGVNAVWGRCPTACAMCVEKRPWRLAWGWGILLLIGDRCCGVGVGVGVR